MKRFLASRFVKLGLILFVFGSGPLLAIIAAASLGLTSDPNPNPIGPGLLAFFTFWPSVILMVIGVVDVLRAEGGEATGTPLTAARVDAPPGGAASSATVARGVAQSIQALIASPLGRGAAALLGIWLIHAGVDGLGSSGRGAGAAILLGILCIWFFVTGRIPAWIRR